jgi:hypothetical protein
MSMVRGSRSFAIIWIPDQVVIVKRLMVKGSAEEGEFNPKMQIERKDIRPRV